jgi:hypothetical protein
MQSDSSTAPKSLQPSCAPPPFLFLDAWKPYQEEEEANRNLPYPRGERGWVAPHCLHTIIAALDEFAGIFLLPFFWDI